MIEAAIPAKDRLYLSASIFEVANPKAVVQIIHGAKEHKERYTEFISWLNANGLNVVITDNRGHGKSINDKYPLGYMENFEELVEDQYTVTTFIKNKYPNLDVYMFGHSFGSMIARIYLEKYDTEIKKLVLSGTANFDKNVNVGLTIGKGIVALGGKTKYSDLLHSFAHFDKDDWVVSNPEVMEAYRNDPLCNYKYMNQAIMTILNADKELHNFKNFACQNPELPILSISGALDPITGGEEGLQDSISSLQKVGYKNIQNIVYPNMKHEVLNEYNKEKVYVDILKFYLS